MTHAFELEIVYARGKYNAVLTVDGKTLWRGGRHGDTVWDLIEDAAYRTSIYPLKLN